MGNQWHREDSPQNRHQAPSPRLIQFQLVLPRKSHVPRLPGLPHLHLKLHVHLAHPRVVLVPRPPELLHQGLHLALHQGLLLVPHQAPLLWLPQALPRLLLQGSLRGLHLVLLPSMLLPVLQLAPLHLVLHLAPRLVLHLEPLLEPHPVLHQGLSQMLL